MSRRRDTPSPDELLAAWAHDARALAPEERAAVERLVEDDPAARGAADETRALVARLRAAEPAPPAEAEGALARAIRDAIDREAARPRPWWRRPWAPALGLGLGLGLAAAAAIAVATPDAGLAPAGRRARDAAVAARPPAPPAPAPDAPDGARYADAPDAPLALGAAGSIDADALAGLDADDVLDAVRLALLAPEPGDEAPALDDDALARLDDDEPAPVLGLLPDLELDWLDDLDDAALDAVTRWLADAG